VFLVVTIISRVIDSRSSEGTYFLLINLTTQEDVNDNDYYSRVEPESSVQDKAPIRLHFMTVLFAGISYDAIMLIYNNTAFS